MSPMLTYGNILTKDVPCPICYRIYVAGDYVVTVKDYLNLGSQQSFCYVMCPCGVFFLLNQPLPEELQRVYSSEYEAYESKRGIVSKIKNRHFVSVMKPLLRHDSNTRILDYGCGSGDFLLSVASQVNGPLVGFDINPPKASSSKIIFVQDENQIKFYGPFDLIVSFQVIEHLPDPMVFLKNLDLLLAEDGIIVIETPSLSGLLFTEFIRTRWGGWHAPRHFVLFSKNTIEKLCNEAGFHVEEFGFIPSPFQWIETIRTFIPHKSKVNRILSLNNFILVAIFYIIDVTLIKLGKKSSNMRLVLRRN